MTRRVSTTLGEIATRIAMGPFGSNIKTDNFVPIGVPVIRGGNLTASRFKDDDFVYVDESKAEELKNAWAFPLDIVITHRGTLGQAAIIPRAAKHAKYIVSQSQMKLSIDPSKADPYFVYYFLNSPVGQQRLLANTSQVGVPAIAQPTSSLKAIEIDLPVSIDEQREISGVLRPLDDKIALNRRLSETLEATAQALFQSWFVDFDPVRAKASGEAPESICQRLGLTPDLLALFPDEFEEVAGNAVPADWSYATTGQVSEVGIGKTPPRKESEWFSENPEHFRWLSIRDMGQSDAFARRSSETLTPEAVERFNIRRVPDYTVLLSFKLTIGRLAITDGEMTTNEAIAHFKLNRETRVTTEYLYFYLKNFDFDSLGSTSSIAEAVNSRMIRELPVLVPPTALIEAFSTQARELLKSIKEVGRQTDNLIQIRDTLLPRLLSGEIALLPAEAP
ncbi:MAG: hypothetical protein A2X76_03670 [Lysobacterales bacterium GWF1_69_6]|nr:MAG: hypothetical protein A2X76_03670 [Xanthomonadales bacterium GWF1_69_6]